MARLLAVHVHFWYHIRTRARDAYRRRTLHSRRPRGNHPLRRIARGLEITSLTAARRENRVLVSAACASRVALFRKTVQAPVNTEYCMLL